MAGKLLANTNALTPGLRVCSHHSISMVHVYLSNNKSINHITTHNTVSNHPFSLIWTLLARSVHFQQGRYTFGNTKNCIPSDTIMAAKSVPPARYNFNFGCQKCTDLMSGIVRNSNQLYLTLVTVSCQVCRCFRQMGFACSLLLDIHPWFHEPYRQHDNIPALCYLHVRCCDSSEFMKFIFLGSSYYKCQSSKKKTVSIFSDSYCCGRLVENANFNRFKKVTNLPSLKCHTKQLTPTYLPLLTYQPVQQYLDILCQLHLYHSV